MLDTSEGKKKNIVKSQAHQRTVALKLYFKAVMPLLLILALPAF